MRIDLGSNLLPSEGAPSVQSGARSGEAVRSSGPESAPAQLSTDHFSAAALSAAVSQFPEVRQEKVAALAEQLRTGNYEVSAKQTAEAMVSQMRASQAA